MAAALSTRRSGWGVAREESETESSSSWLMMDAIFPLFCVVNELKIVGGKGVCILGYAKFMLPGMHPDLPR